MTTIAHIVSQKEDVMSAMRQYIGYSFQGLETRSKIVEVYPYPLRELGQPFFPLTTFFETLTGLKLTYPDLPVFLAVNENAVPLDSEDPDYLNLLLINGGFFLPPEVCDLSTGSLVVDV
jgi:hypothetical protein